MGRVGRGSGVVVEVEGGVDPRVDAHALVLPSAVPSLAAQLAPTTRAESLARSNADRLPSNGRVGSVGGESFGERGLELVESCRVGRSARVHRMEDEGEGLFDRAELFSEGLVGGLSVRAQGESALGNRRGKGGRGRTEQDACRVWTRQRCTRVRLYDSACREDRRLHHSGSAITRGRRRYGQLPSARSSPRTASKRTLSFLHAKQALPLLGTSSTLAPSSPLTSPSPSFFFPLPLLPSAPPCEPSPALALSSSGETAISLLGLYGAGSEYGLCCSRPRGPPLAPPPPPPLPPLGLSGYPVCHKWCASSCWWDMGASEGVEKCREAEEKGESRGRGFGRASVKRLTWGLVELLRVVLGAGVDCASVKLSSKRVLSEKGGVNHSEGGLESETNFGDSLLRVLVGFVLFSCKMGQRT